MIIITFEVDKFTTKAELYDIDFGGSRLRKIYDLEPGKTNVLVLPVSMEDWKFNGRDGGCMLSLFGERKRGKPYEYYLKKSECKVEDYADESALQHAKINI